MRALIAGFGSIGRRHAINLQKLLDPVEFILLRSKEEVDSAGQAPGVTLAGNLEAALRAKPDLAVISNASSRHADVLIPLLEAGIPCYIEKPVVTREDDARRLHAVLDKMDSVPVTLAGCNLRFLPSLIKLRALLEEGVTGNVVRASLQVGQWLPDWRPGRDYRLSYSANPQMGGGAILDLIHEIDMARWLFGEFDRVMALAGKLSSLDIATEDTACMLLGKNRGGPFVHVSVDYVSRKPVRRYEIVGDEGTLVWDLGSRRLELSSPRGEDVIDCGDLGFDIASTYVSAMSEFVDCVGQRCPTSQDIREGLMSAELALRARASAGL